MLDKLYSFNAKLTVIKPKIAKSGLLELHTCSENNTYIFKGVLSEEECIAAVKAAGYAMVANQHSPLASMYIDNNSRNFTVYVSGGASGFIRVIEC
jgi:hypothetical protein